MKNDELLTRIRQIWDAASGQAARTVNSAHVCANWLIGQQIVEAEQDGEERAEYGTRLLKNLSELLTIDYGTGFSFSTLKYMRAFYLAYPSLIPIGHAPRGLLGNDSADTKLWDQQRISSFYCFLWLTNATTDFVWNELSICKRSHPIRNCGVGTPRAYFA